MYIRGIKMNKLNVIKLNKIEKIVFYIICYIFSILTLGIFGHLFYWRYMEREQYLNQEILCGHLKNNKLTKDNIKYYIENSFICFNLGNNYQLSYLIDKDSFGLFENNTICITTSQCLDRCSGSYSEQVLILLRQFITRMELNQNSIFVSVN